MQPNDQAMEAKEERVAEGIPVAKPPKQVKVGTPDNMNPLEKEPVLAAALVSGIVFFGAKYGFDVDTDTATYIAGVVLAVLSFLARQIVVPLKKAEAGMEANYRANPAVDAEAVI
jgi:hypothetical protein